MNVLALMPWMCCDDLNTSSLSSSLSSAPSFSGETSWIRPTTGRIQKGAVMRAVPGTEWCECFTPAGDRYFYSRRSGVTSWEVPEEIASLVMGPGNDMEEEVLVEGGGEGNGGSSGALPGAQQGQAAREGGDGSVVVAGADMEEVVNKEEDLEEKKAKFKRFLLEKGVVAGSSWEKELSKFCFDSRYKTILDNPTERKSVFHSLSKIDVMKYKEEQMMEEVNKKAAVVEQAKKVLESFDRNGMLTYDMDVESIWAHPIMGEKLKDLDVERTERKIVVLVKELTQKRFAEKRKEVGGCAMPCSLPFSPIILPFAPCLSVCLSFVLFPSSYIPISTNIDIHTYLFSFPFDEPDGHVAGG
eukprot:752068-Hanusia_phi.AAC.3